jgi:hypothetical protein
MLASSKTARAIQGLRRRPIWLVFVAASALLVTACGVAGAKQDAERALVAHFAALRASDDQAALDGYSEQFFAKTPRPQAAQILRNLTAKVGQYQSHQIVGWNVNRKVGTGAGTYVTMKVHVTYSKSSTDEQLVFFRASSGDPIKIFAHSVSTSLL